MDEEWRELEEFPGYCVSDHGRVMHSDTGHIKEQTLNQRGIPTVIFRKDGTLFRRSVTVLVASAFLDPPRYPHFDTPINLDGDRTNNHVDNLMWRPRWFAIRYHQQFQHPERRGYKQPVMDMATREIYPTSWDAATKFGLLDIEILVAAANRTYVFPTGQQFRPVD